MAGVKPLLETIGALLPKGIKAWHASPHDFDKFDLSKIGTGQGAASYGPGIYAAESPKVSGVGGEYWKEFAGHFTGSGPDVDPVMSHAVQYLEHLGGDRKAALAMVNTAIENTGNLPQRPRLEAVRDLLASDKQVGPRVYELNIKADPQSFLQWDKPLKEQAAVAEKMPELRANIAAEANSRALSATSKPRWEELWGMVKDPTQAPASFGLQRMNQSMGPQLMELMRSRDIPGIRYADAASRNPQAAASTAYAVQTAKRRLQFAEDKGAPKWEIDHFRQSVKDAEDRVAREIAATPRTYNYVLNNPDIIEIMRKFAVPGMVGGGAVTAYQPQGSQ